LKSLTTKKLPKAEELSSTDSWLVAGRNSVRICCEVRYLPCPAEKDLAKPQRIPDEKRETTTRTRKGEDPESKKG